MGSKWAFLTAVPLLASMLPACSDALAGSADGEITEVLVTAQDYSFTDLDTIPAGLTRVRLVNEGSDFHHLQFLRIEEGHTFEEFRKHAEAGEVFVPWVKAVGGPNVPQFGAHNEVLVDLEPGQYAVLCLIPSDGTPHFMKGMIQSLTVVASHRTQPARPATDVRILLDNYWFGITPKLTAGRHTIRVENRATQAHELVMMRLMPGKTFEHVMTFLGGSEEGPPPFELVAGTTALARGEVNIIELDLAPGNYLLLCFIPDAKDGKAHIEHGMIEEIVVE